MPTRHALRGAWLLLALWSVSAVAADEFVGRRLADVLRSQGAHGVQFVFSSALVPESLRVERAPEADPSPGARRIAFVAALLAQYGLALQLIEPGVYAVVRGPMPTVDSVTSSLEEIFVSASRYRLAVDSQDAAMLDATDLMDQPSPGDDPLRSIARLPGIVQDGVSAQGHVRGGESGEVLVLLDGYPIRRAFHLPSYQPLFSVIDASLLSSADVFTGAFPVRYGNRMSGVFDLHTLDAASSPRHSVAADVFNLSGLWSGRSPGSSFDWLADARLGTLAPLLHVFAPDAGSPRYSDAYLRLGHGDPESVRITGNLLWAHDEIEARDDSRGERAQIYDLSQYLWVRAEKRWNEAFAGNLWLGHSRIQTGRVGSLDDAAIAVGRVDDHRDSTLWDLRARFDWALRENHHLQWGMEFTQERARYDYKAQATYTPVVATLFERTAAIFLDEALAPRRRRTAFFGAHRWKFASGWVSEVGLRGQAVVTNGLETRWDLDPRLGLRWDPRRGTRLHVNYGRHHQADEVNELKVEDGLTNFPAPQRSTHLIVGLEQQLDADVSLRAEYFSKQQTHPRARFENIFNRRTILPEISPDRIRVLPEYAELRGFELSVDWRRDEWHAWAATGWSQADDETAGQHTARSWDTGWSLSGGVRWQRGPWSAVGAWSLHRGFPTTRLEGTPSNPELGQFNGARVSSYVGVDARVDYQRPMPKGTLVYTVELFNALNHANDCCSDLILSEGTYSLLSLRGLPLLPSVGIRFSW